MTGQCGETKDAVVAFAGVQWLARGGAAQRWAARGGLLGSVHACARRFRWGAARGGRSRSAGQAGGWRGGARSLFAGHALVRGGRQELLVGAQHGVAQRRADGAAGLYSRGRRTAGRTGPRACVAAVPVWQPCLFRGTRRGVARREADGAAGLWGGGRRATGRTGPRACVAARYTSALPVLKT